jgi:hypothetical protein
MLRKILLSTSLLPLFAACGGQADTLWQVSELVMSAPASCYADGKLPNMTTTEMGVQTDVGPWEIYDGPNSKEYLVLADTNKTVIEGTKSDSFNFTWTVTNTDNEPPPIMYLNSHSTTNTITFKTSGNTMTGTWEVKDTYTCTGQACTDVTPNCDVTSTINGAQLDVSRYKVY